MLLPQYADNFLIELTKAKKKNSTIKRYNTDLTIFFKWLSSYKPATSIDDVEICRGFTTDDITAYFEYLNNKNYSPDTIRRLASVLNGLFSYLNINKRFNPKGSNIAVKRDLNATDFITNGEWHSLLDSFHNIPTNSARYVLKERNISILIFMRIYGLTPSEVHNIDMQDINFAQQTIRVRSDKFTRTFFIKNQDIEILLRYFNGIPKELRPRYQTPDPLFVAYYNQTCSYHFDYSISQPKRLSVRAIQKMIKEEIENAGLKNLSSTNLRNSSILDMLKNSIDDEYIVSYFGFSNSFSLKRFKKAHDLNILRK